MAIYLVCHLTVKLTVAELVWAPDGDVPSQAIGGVVPSPEGQLLETGLSMSYLQLCSAPQSSVEMGRYTSKRMPVMLHCVQ